MKQFLSRLVPVFLFLCAACTEADIVSPVPDGGEAEEDRIHDCADFFGYQLSVESRFILDKGLIALYSVFDLFHQDVVCDVTGQGTG